VFLLIKLINNFQNELLNALKQQEPAFLNSTYKVEPNGDRIKCKLTLESVDNTLTSTFQVILVADYHSESEYDSESDYMSE
jgi:hypothetical protein